jgi:hypothetical protein
MGEPLAHFTHRFSIFLGKLASPKLAEVGPNLVAPAFMERTAFLVRHRRDEAHPSWENSIRAGAFAIGQHVCIATGPLRGLRGRLTSEMEDGKWVIEVAEAGRGVLVCIGAHQLSRV